MGGDSFAWIAEKIAVANVRCNVCVYGADIQKNVRVVCGHGYVGSAFSAMKIIVYTCFFYSSCNTNQGV